MKKAAVLGAILCASVSLFADPAKSVKLTLSGDTLKVTAQHKVGDPAVHYISKITVSVNDSLAVSKEYTSQTDKNAMIQSFVLPHDLLKPGASIYAETTCNKYGTKIGILKLTAKGK